MVQAGGDDDVFQVKTEEESGRDILKDFEGREDRIY